MMIVIVARFETDGDYCVDNAKAGLTSPPDDDYCHGGIFLCADTDEAEAVLSRVVQSVTDKGNWYGGVYQDHIFTWLKRAVNEASSLLRGKAEILRHGWLKLASGNYAGTLLFMQEVHEITDLPATPLPPVYKENTSNCRYTAPYCPACGHILMDDNNDQFNYCPDCGQAIDWRGDTP